jgi:hypothetical protein
MLRRAAMIFASVVVLDIAATIAVPEPLTDPDKSAFAAAMKAVCAAKHRRGYDDKGVRFNPPFTEEEISSYCGCTSSTMADIMTKEEYISLTTPNTKPPDKLMASMMEKATCVAVEKCKKHLNLAYPEKFQYEQCWKG